MAFCIGNMTGVVAAMVGTVFAKMAVSKLSEMQQVRRLEQWTDYFHRVTNNLNAHY